MAVRESNNEESGDEESDEEESDDEDDSSDEDSDDGTSNDARPDLRLRLQMDNDVVAHCMELCQRVREVEVCARLEDVNREWLIDHLDTLLPSLRSMKRLGRAMVLTQYRKRTSGAPLHMDKQMTKESEDRVENLYAELQAVVRSKWGNLLLLAIEVHWLNPFASACIDEDMFKLEARRR